MEYLQLYVFPHLNFIIFCSILFFAGRKAVAEIFSGQRSDFDLALQTGQASLKVAREDQAEIIERMNGLESEIKKLRDSSLAVTNSEIAKLKEETSRSVEHLRSDAQRIARMELQSAQDSLRQSVIGKAVKGVEASLIQSIRGRDSSQQKSLLAKAFDEFEAADFKSEGSGWSAPKAGQKNFSHSTAAPVS